MSRFIFDLSINIPSRRLDYGGTGRTERFEHNRTGVLQRILSDFETPLASLALTCFILSCNLLSFVLVFVAFPVRWAWVFLVSIPAFRALFLAPWSSATTTSHLLQILFAYPYLHVFFFHVHHEP